MKVLILGGTQFLGRHFAEIAFDQGYQVTLFNRGQTNSSLYPNMEKLLGDRLKGDLSALKQRKWDVVIDTAGYFQTLPQLVRNTVELLKDSISTYVFISTISVYPEFQANGDETLPLYPIDRDPPQEMNPEAYGTLKAMADGLSFRSLGDTIRDIWQWDQVEQPKYDSGLSRDKETAILQAWHT